MKCAEVKCRLSAFQDKEVDASTYTEIQKHLRVCADCQLEWQQLQQVCRQVEALAEMDVSPRFTATVMSRIKQKSQARRTTLPVWVYSLVFVLAFATGFIFDDIAGSSQEKMKQKTITHLLVESQDLSLISVQDPTMNLIADAGSSRHGR